MEERLLAALDAVAGLRRQLSLKLGRAHAADGPPVETLSLILRTGLADAVERSQAALTGMVSTELRAQLNPQIADPDLIDRLVDDLFERLPALLDRLRDLLREAPESRTQLGKKDVTRLLLRGPGTVLPPARVEELVQLVQETRAVSLRASSWQRQLESRISGRIAIHILGIGEITTTIEVEGRHWYKIHPVEKRRMRLAYKRMPAFENRAAADAYMAAHMRYQELLAGLGIQPPWHDNLLRQRPDGRWVVYNRQERYLNRLVACLIIRELSAEHCVLLFDRVLAVLGALFRHNLSGDRVQLGMDGQIPNWILSDYQPGNHETVLTSPLVYIDTSTPLFRVDGVEQMDAAIFLKSVPLVFRPLLRHTLLPGIVQRYYQPREVILDLIASYITHGRPDVAGELTGRANRFLDDLGVKGKPLTAEEVKSYNSQDVLIWKFFRTLKRMDRFVAEKLLGKKYEQRLPPGSPSGWENLVGAGGAGLTPEEQEK